MHKTYKYSLIPILFLAFACSNEGDYKKDLSLDVDIQETESEILISINIENNSDYEYYFPASNIYFSGYLYSNTHNWSSIYTNHNKINYIKFYPKQDSGKEIYSRNGNQFKEKLPVIYNIGTYDSLKVIMNIKKTQTKRKYFSNREYAFLTNIIFLSKNEIEEIKDIIPDFKKIISHDKNVKYTCSFDELGFCMLKSINSNIKVNNIIIDKIYKITNKNIQAKQIFTANE